MEFVLIHTGGTIGMVPSPQGLVPEPGRIEQAVAEMLPAAARLTCHAFDPLLDSANLGPAHWNRMLDLIDAHPGAEILLTHGTDTMSFTGAALAAALAGRDLRVMMVGAMAPLGAGQGARANLNLAVATLCDPGWSGVKCAFARQILDAGGLVKHDTQGEDAFRSVAQDALPTPPHRRFEVGRFGVLSLSPGMPAAALAGALEGLDGLVLRVFGAGTVMDDPEVRAALTGAIAAGKRIRAVSQCESGGLVVGAYAAGQALWDAGVENGGRETAEAALARLWLGA